jgi:hypothetical protein
VIVILQSAIGENALQQIEISRPSWEKLADKFDGSYVLNTEWNTKDKHKAPHWTKVDLILRYIPLLTKNDLIIWADTDTKVRRFDVDPRSVQLQHIAMVARSFKPFEYNSGIIFIRPTKHMQKIFESVMEKGPMGYTQDQGRLTNELIRTKTPVTRLSHDWNDYRFVRPRSENPIVSAWHGFRPRSALVLEMSKN